jgi:hypothetical protein
MAVTGAHALLYTSEPEQLTGSETRPGSQRSVQPASLSSLHVGQIG